MANKSAPNELHSVLQAFKTVFKSIEVRTIAVKPTPEGPWQNLMTAVTVSKKSLQEVIRQQKTLPLVSNDEFLFHYDVFPFELSFFSQVEQGEIHFKKPGGDLKVSIRSFNPLILRAVSGPYQGNFLNATASGREDERRKLWEIIGNQNYEAKRKGFFDIWQLLNNILGVPYGYIQNKDFEVNISSFACISDAYFNGKKFEVKLRKPANLTGLQLNVILKKRNIHPPEVVWNDIREVKNAKYVFKPNNLVPFDSVDVELIHKDSALTFDSKTVEVPLANTVEPVLTALNDFCPLTEFKRMLFEPQLCGDQPNQIFETAISWLLAISGFTVLHLGIVISTSEKTKRNIVKKKQTDAFTLGNNYHVGTSDIIAYNNHNALFLIDCDLKANDVRKMKDLIETQKYYQKTFEGSNLRIVPVLCTPQEINYFNQDGVHLFSSYRIKQMFEELMRGNKEEARSVLNYVF